VNIFVIQAVFVLEKCSQTYTVSILWLFETGDVLLYDVCKAMTQTYKCSVTQPLIRLIKIHIKYVSHLQITKITDTEVNENLNELNKRSLGSRVVTFGST